MSAVLFIRTLKKGADMSTQPKSQKGVKFSVGPTLTIPKGSAAHMFKEYRMLDGTKVKVMNRKAYERAIQAFKRSDSK